MTIVSYVKQVAEALQYAHDEKLVHRDVKPENMLLARRDEILLSDFGIAIAAQSSHYQSTQDIIGTPAYMAPEQLQGKPRPASDQYSLGIVVYEWLCGSVPFQGNFYEIASQHMLTSPPLLHKKIPTISLDVEQVILKALTKDPQARFADIQAFAAALELVSQEKQLPFVSPSQPSSLLMKKLGNKYLLGELLGRGGFGEVYKAQNILLNRPQAIKVLLKNDPAFQVRFHREAQTLASLEHANILKVHDFDFDSRENKAYLVMPFIRGGTLLDRMEPGVPLSLVETERYLKQICAALDYAHAKGIVHLDLKPANLLCQEDGTLLLADFGIAHLMKEEAIEGGSSLLFGTPGYMAPEQYEGRPQQRSDIYALGMILYCMLTGRGPAGIGTDVTITSLRGDLPRALDGVVKKALAKNPQARYATAGQLLADFKDALSTPSTHTREHAAPPGQNPSSAVPAENNSSLDSTLLAGNRQKPPMGQRTTNGAFQSGVPKGTLSSKPARRPYIQAARDILAGVLGAGLNTGIIVVLGTSFGHKISTSDFQVPDFVPPLMLAGAYIVGILTAALSGREGSGSAIAVSINTIVFCITFVMILPHAFQVTLLFNPAELLIIVILLWEVISLLGAATYAGISKVRRKNIK